MTLGLIRHFQINDADNLKLIRGNCGARKYEQS